MNKTKQRIIRTLTRRFDAAVQTNDDDNIVRYSRELRSALDDDAKDAARQKASRPPSNHGFEIEDLTDAEGLELDQLLLGFEQFKARVRSRLGADPVTVLAPPPLPPVTEPEPETVAPLAADPLDDVVEILTRDGDGTAHVEVMTEREAQGLGWRGLDEVLNDN